MLHRAAITIAADESAGCFLLAYLGDDPVGIACLETEVDAGLLGALFVVEQMRRQGIGAQLVSAAKLAAHTRGARMLYAAVPQEFVVYLARFGFTETVPAEVTRTIAEASMVLPIRSDEMRRCITLRLDLSGEPWGIATA